MRCAIGVQQYEVDFPWKNGGSVAKVEKVQLSSSVSGDIYLQNMYFEIA
jgi:hypothetical protein